MQKYSSEHSNPNVLIISPVDPRRVRSGNSQRVREVIELLTKSDFTVDVFIIKASNSDVHGAQFYNASEFVSVQSTSFSRNFALILKSICLFPIYSTKAFLCLIAVLVSFLNHARAFGIRALKNELYFFSPKCFFKLSKISVLGSHKVIISNYAFSSFYLFLFSRTLKVVDTHDVFSRKNAYHIEKFDDYSAIPQNYEIKLLKRSDVIIAIQEHEGAELKRMVLDREVIVNPPTYRIENSSSPKTFTIGYVAGENVYNLAGIKWFMSEIFPLLLGEIPEIKLKIAGPIGKYFRLVDNPYILIMGELEDLKEFYSQVSVMINPSTHGTGIKIKTVEAICNSKYIFATPNAVEGIDERLLEYCFVNVSTLDWIRSLKKFHSNWPNKAKTTPQLNQDLVIPRVLKQKLGLDV